MVSKGSWTKGRKTRSKYTVLRFRIKGSRRKVGKTLGLDLGEQVGARSKLDSDLDKQRLLLGYSYHVHARLLVTG